MDILTIDGTPTTMNDVQHVISTNNEFKLALENVALKRMVREMQANADEAKSEDPPEAPEEPGEAPQAAD